MTCRDILNLILKSAPMTLEEFITQSRDPDFRRAHWLYAYTARECTGKSFQMITKVIRRAHQEPKYDQETIRTWYEYACKALMPNEATYDKRFADLVNVFMNKIKEQ